MYRSEFERMLSDRKNVSVGLVREKVCVFDDDCFGCYRVNLEVSLCGGNHRFVARDGDYAVNNRAAFKRSCIGIYAEFFDGERRSCRIKRLSVFAACAVCRDVDGICAASNILDCALLARVHACLHGDVCRAYAFCTDDAVLVNGCHFFVVAVPYRVIDYTVNRRVVWHETF